MTAIWHGYSTTDNPGHLIWNICYPLVLSFQGAAFYALQYPDLHTVHWVCLSVLHMLGLEWDLGGGDQNFQVAMPQG